MRLESINNIVSAEFRKVESSKKKAASDSKSPKLTRGDKASLSTGAQKMSETAASSKMVAARITAEPDVRANKIAEVKGKIESGYYNSSQFADQLADKLIKDFGL